MSTPDDLHSDAIREMELDELAFLHEAGEHDEKPLIDICLDCETRFEDAKAEHAWMGRAVQTWTGGNPYAPSDPQSPQRDWYIDEQGYVKADA